MGPTDDDDPFLREEKSTRVETAVIPSGQPAQEFSRHLVPVVPCPPGLKSYPWAFWYASTTALGTRPRAEIS